MDSRERYQDFHETMRAVLEGHQSSMWTALPGIIQSVDLVKLTVTVQPAIQAINMKPGGQREDISIPLLVDVPINFPRGGGYTATFPIKAGDECTVVFSSRCIDNWWQQGGVQPQFESRMHDLSDGMAFVGPFSQKTKIDKVSSTTAQLRSDDGTQFVEIDTPNKKVRAVSDDVSVELDSAAHNITMTAPQQININADTINITGKTAITLKAPLIKEN